MGTKISLRTDDLGGQFTEYIDKVVKKRDTFYIITLASIIISAIFRFNGLGAYILNIIYFINISYFALIAKDSWALRTKNIIPLIVTVVSILLTLTALLEILEAVDFMMNMEASLEQMFMP